MTNPDKTLIGILVDHSGSMQTMDRQMTQAIAEFLTAQKEQPGRAEVTLAEFDWSYDVVYPPTDIKDIPTYTLMPRGSTALLDAMGTFLTDIGVQLKARKEDKRPGKVIIVIVTDGHENASREWTYQKVQDLVKRQQEKYSWEFIFLGANIDAVAEASKFGIARHSAMTYTAASTPVAMASMSNYVSASRSGVSAGFTDADRQAAMGDEGEE